LDNRQNHWRKLNLKVYKGELRSRKKDLIGRITKSDIPFFKRNNYIFVSKNCKNRIAKYKAIVSKDKIGQVPIIETPNLYNIPNIFFDNVNDGDIALIDNTGKCVILWEKESKQNCILLTEECNCKCWMCPQPPKKDDNNIDYINKKILTLIDPSSASDICITGGEPTLYEKRLIEYLRIIKDRFPESNVTILTNGKKLSDFNLVKKIYEIGLKKLVFCISVHADTDNLHDYICRAKGSFSQTVRGIYNLAKFRQKIEIRFVINKLNFRRLEAFSNFIYKNFPFVIHVAYMGLEITGYADKNSDKIWIDPLDYKYNLKKAIIDTNKKGLNTSIYNVPLCLLSKEIWRFSRKSISQWKNSYLDMCDNCIVKKDCCGIFTTSTFNSPHLAPVKETI
jgi:His-Xaa-Ser system radical SAM maturase HxsC